MPVSYYRYEIRKYMMWWCEMVYIQGTLPQLIQTHQKSPDHFSRVHQSNMLGTCRDRQSIPIQMIYSLLAQKGWCRDSGSMWERMCDCSSAHYLGLNIRPWVVYLVDTLNWWCVKQHELLIWRYDIHHCEVHHNPFIRTDIQFPHISVECHLAIITTMTCIWAFKCLDVLHHENDTYTCEHIIISTTITWLSDMQLWLYNMSFQSVLACISSTVLASYYGLPLDCSVLNRIQRWHRITGLSFLAYHMIHSTTGNGLLHIMFMIYVWLIYAVRVWEDPLELAALGVREGLFPLPNPNGAVSYEISLVIYVISMNGTWKHTLSLGGLMRDARWPSLRSFFDG